MLLASYAFYFQLFCDFAGYSNIARGLGRMMGFGLTSNFVAPMFAASPREFWSRWHVTLSTWFRDYVYRPLGWSRIGTLRSARNLFVTMLLAGLWHGASSNFVAFGAYFGLLLVLDERWRVFSKRRGSRRRAGGSRLGLAARIVGTFHLVVVSEMLFRSRSLAQFWDLLASLGSGFAASTPTLVAGGGAMLFYCWLVVIVEARVWRLGSVDAALRMQPILRIAFYLVLFYSLAFWGNYSDKAFIYFQF